MVPRDLAVVLLGAWAPPGTSPLGSGLPFCQPEGPFGLAWGLLAGLRGLPAMGAFYCLGAG